MAESMKEIIHCAIGHTYRCYNRISFEMQKCRKQIVVFNTSSNTDNLGDYIIMRYCYQVLDEIFGEKDYIDISTHRIPTKEDEHKVKATKYKFVCGTNLLTSHIEQWWNWRLPDGFRGKIPYRNVILMGAGWGTYQDECSDYSKMIYRCLLCPSVLHSVRDQYTEEKLKSIGINNVINTGCPTMWNLTPEFCKEIPVNKARDVITTVTDYRRDVKSDNLMLNILSKNYRHVFLWLQGKRDEEYLNTLQRPSNLIVVPRKLEAYEELLKQGSIDYVGTRLHAGIFALNYKIRSIIVAVDNRAIEIARDTNLPIILRDAIGTALDEKINRELQMNIKINVEHIQRFKRQFR